MRRKSERRDKEGDTILIFKKSNNSICTQSRTCSGASQFYTRSAILQLKKNLSKAKKYIDGDNVKRDFSIETDICILRRYYKSKRLKMSNQAHSTKSKYSTVIDTELDEMDEFKPDSSACGDSRHTVTNDKMPKVDLASVMIDNLKELLKSWIHKHLLHNRDNNEKIDTVLDSMLHLVDLHIAEEANSQSTYILNIEQKPYQVKNKKLETTPIMCQYCKHKLRPLIINSSKTIVYKGYSSHLVPFTLKKIRLVSTLSVPRNVYRIRKINSRHIRKIGLSIARSSKQQELSNLNLLAISTKSLTKRCATYDLRTLYEKASIAYFPLPPNKDTIIVDGPNASQIKIENQILNRDNLEDMPSLFKSIYVDDPANVTSDEKIITKPPNDIFIETDNSTNSEKILKISEENSENRMLNNEIGFHIKSINEKPQSEYLLNTKFKNKYFESPNKQLSEYKQNYSTSIKINKRKFKNRRKGPQIQRVQNKHFSIQYNKINNKQTENKQLLNSFQNVLKYLTYFGSNKNIKFDININCVPLEGGIDKCTLVTNEIFCNGVGSKSTVTYLEHIIDITEDLEQNVKENHENIPLVDDASQSKYSSNNEISISITTTQGSVENKKTMDSNDLELVKEIGELKSVIKNLAVVVEQFIAERYKEDEIFPVETIKSKNQTIFNKSSKGVQFSSNFQTLFQYGVKLSKEPKKDANEYYNRLMKKSNSYNIIESESVLKVTDMTVINELNNQKIKEEGLTCSLPKSRSLYEMTNDKKGKIATYYCERCTLKPDYVYDCKASAYTPCCKMNTVSNESKCSSKSSKSKKNSTPWCICTDSYAPMKKDSDKSSKCKECSVLVRLSDKDCNSSPVCRNKAGLGFGEGFLYCLLLWIPVIILMCLFYSYVLEDIIHPDPKLSGLREGNGKHLRSKENGTIDIKLSDLGF